MHKIDHQSYLRNYDMQPRFAIIILLQNDLEKAISFYTKLGFQMQFHLPNQWAEMSLDTLRIGLAVTQEALSAHRTGIVLEVADVRAWCEQLAQQGINCFEPVDGMHGIMSGMQDPGGNIIDVYQPTPERIKEALDKKKETS